MNISPNEANEINKILDKGILEVNTSNLSNSGNNYNNYNNYNHNYNNYNNNNFDCGRFSNVQNSLNYDYLNN